MARKKKKDSQVEKILAYMKVNGSISSYEGHKIGVSYLPARIKDLRAEGVKITSVMRYVYDDCDNFLFKYKEYSLLEDER